MKPINPLDYEVIVKPISNGEWHWQLRHRKSHAVLGNCAETHKRKSYTILRALAVANGRTVLVQNKGHDDTEVYPVTFEDGKLKEHYPVV